MLDRTKRFSFLAAAISGLVWADSAVSADRSFPNIENGRKLAIIGDCVACHTVEGGAPFAGGLAMETPFGTIVTPNITPNREHGIGKWTDEEFIRAMQEGKGHEGENLYPAFPYTAYTKISRGDLLDIKAYLDTIEPSPNVVVVNQMPFPFNIRLSLFGWNILFFEPGEFKSDPSKSETWNRGAYLVGGLGHCSSCHSPRNALGGEDNGRFLQGAVLQGWFAPNITNEARIGLGSWSEDDVVEYLKTGRNTRANAAGPMAEVVANSTSHMEDDDLKAIANYLKSLAGSGETQPTSLPSNDPRMVAGSKLYDVNCSACHSGDGQAAPRIVPPLKGSASVQSTDATTLARVVLEGANAVTTKHEINGMSMPAFSWRLTDEDVASLLTYVRNSWGNAAPAVEPNFVASTREAIGSNSALGVSRAEQ